MLVKLHSFLVAADAACSKGDLPVVTVDAMLVAVTGLAAAVAATVVPAELAAAVPVLPIAASGAAQPCRRECDSVRVSIQKIRISGWLTF
jgi:hypothetical protein